MRRAHDAASQRTWNTGWLGLLPPLLAVLLYAAYWLHLDSDMPDAVRWNDYARFTDEGWYSAAALHRALGGSWYQPHSFNAAAALPAWPALLHIVFAVTGPTMAAARGTALALFGVALLLLFVLLRPYCGTPLAAGAVLLVLLNPYTYNFTRMAMLEPALVCVTTGGLALALAAGQWRARPGALVLSGMALGTLLCVAVLVKTTGLVLLPPTLAAGWCAVRNAGATRRVSLVLPAVAMLTAAVLWVAWFTLLIAPHHLADYRHLFAINAEPAHTLHAVGVAEAKAVYDLFWLGRLFFPLVLLSLLLSVLLVRDLWRQPLFVALVLQLGCYVGFLGWHANRQQRYEVVCLLPAAGIVAMALAAMQRRPGAPALFPATLLLATLAALLFARQTLPALLHPRYTWRDSARAVAATIRADRAQRPVLLAGPGDDIALFTGLETWNPRWPPDGLQPLLDAAQPGWYLAPVPTEDDTVAQLQQRYRLQLADSFVAMPTFSHRSLVLYRLLPHEDTGRAPAKLP